jgi:carbonic anhydrase
MPVHTTMRVTDTARLLVSNSTHHFQHLSPDMVGRYPQLAKRRDPRAAIYGCVDSVYTTEPFGLDIGDIANHRNAGNCIMPSERAERQVDGAAASIDIMVAKQSLEAIGVVGHQDCAFCAALLTQQYPPEHQHLRGWVDYHGPLTRAHMLDRFGPPPAVEDTENWDRYLWDAVQQHAIRQHNNLLSYPSVMRRVEEGTLTVFAAVLQLTPEPKFLWLDPTVDRFKEAA